MTTSTSSYSKWLESDAEYIEHFYDRTMCYFPQKGDRLKIIINNRENECIILNIIDLDKMMVEVQWIRQHENSFASEMENIINLNNTTFIHKTKSPKKNKHFVKKWSIELYNYLVQTTKKDKGDLYVNSEYEDFNRKFGYILYKNATK